MFLQKFKNCTFEFIETCSENGPVSVKLCHLSKLIGWYKRQEQSISKVSGLNDHTVFYYSDYNFLLFHKNFVIIALIIFITLIACIILHYA